ncbi:MAG: EF-P lysine aminoacylase GenX [Planctomycetales bacterium]|nr:EF-P lysine aminoacylase GenX [Planctomycetales bacterium]
MWRPTATLDTLRRRAELLARLRRFFDARGFVEVETPMLCRDTVVDLHLDPLSASVGETEAFLQTSPEFCMKRLLAAGAEAIYQVTHAFRAEELGPRHNIEFTMAEWYRCGQSYADAISLLGELCGELLSRGAAEVVTYREAFERLVGLDPHAATAAQLRTIASDRGVPAPELGDDVDGWRCLLLAELVEPRLGRERPTILCDYPGTQAALAQVRKDDRGALVASRFELYVDGVELANGYHELLDAGELRRRSAEANRQREHDRKRTLPETSRLADAMDSGLPDCCGVALGFDRLVMCAVGAEEISEVMPFPWPRA